MSKNESTTQNQSRPWENWEALGGLICLIGMLGSMNSFNYGWGAVPQIVAWTIVTAGVLFVCWIVWSRKRAMAKPAERRAAKQRTYHDEASLHD